MAMFSSAPWMMLAVTESTRGEPARPAAGAAMLATGAEVLTSCFMTVHPKVRGSPRIPARASFHQTDFESDASFTYGRHERLVLAGEETRNAVNRGGRRRHFHGYRAHRHRQKYDHGAQSGQHPGRSVSGRAARRGGNLR